MRRKRIVVAALGALVVMGASAAAVVSAHEGAMGVVKQRMELMKSIAKNMKALSLMMRSQTTYDAAVFKASVQAIKSHAGASITKLFPEGSMGHPSEATAKIWQDWDRFEANAKRLAMYAGALEAMAAAGFPTRNGKIEQPPSRGSGSMVDVPPLSDDGFLQAAHVKHVPPHMIFQFMAKTCKSCHETFRVKKQK
ncbi:MAG: c-type cytochrome [Methyloligellaceae bacterium]